MSKNALKIKNFSSEALKSILNKDDKFRKSVRLFACYQVSLGKRPKELADLYGTSFKSICNWVNRLNSGGVEALVDKVKIGRNSRLTVEQQLLVKEVIMNDCPSKHGYNSSTWTGLMLIDWIDKKFKIQYKKAQIYNILRKLGLSFQKGKGVYPETETRDEKIELLKKKLNQKKN